MATTKVIATHVQDYEARKNIFASSGLLAKWPIIGLVMFLFGGLMFGGLTYNLLADGPLLKLDTFLANSLPAIGLQGPPIIKIIMEASFYIGNEVIIGLGVLVGFYFIIKKYWQQLAMLALGLAGSTSLFMLLSSAIGRVRPSNQIWNIVKMPGFPSGHAIAVVVFYGLMAYLLAPNISSAFWKLIVVGGAIFIIGFVGFSRVFTGGHYLTDVLAGYSVGIAWSGVVYTLIELYFQKRNTAQRKI